MPNWVFNEITCANTQALLELREFNRIIPMPLILAKTECGSNSNHFKRLYGTGKSLDQLLDSPPRYHAWKTLADGTRVETSEPLAEEKWHPLCRRYYVCQRLYGYADWYDWALEHWGCKWSADEYLLADNGTSCTFMTPWSHPHLIIEALSKRYPESIISVRFADEDIGSNAGCYVIQNGVYLVPDKIVCESKEAYEVAFSLWNVAEDYRYDEGEGTYVYIDQFDMADDTLEALQHSHTVTKGHDADANAI